MRCQPQRTTRRADPLNPPRSADIGQNANGAGLSNSTLPTLPSEACPHPAQVTVRGLAGEPRRLRRADRWPDQRETNVADADEAQRLAQIGRRHIDASAIHAGDEIAAAGQDYDRGPVLQQRKVALSRIEAEGQPRLDDK